MHKLHLQAERMRGYWAIHGRDVGALLAASSGLALGYNVVHSLMIKHTSAVATTVVGEAKIAGLLLLSYFVLGAPAALLRACSRCCAQAPQRAVPSGAASDL
jgi:hypothetical protein